LLSALSDSTTLPVGILIGIDFYHAFMTGKIIGLFTVFDDILSGRQEFSGAVTKPNINHYCSATSGVYCLAISQKITF
jgi:hypothetical protein